MTRRRAAGPPAEGVASSPGDYQAAVVDHMADGAAVVRARDGLILYTNSSWDDMFGYDHGALLGNDMSTLIAGTDEVPERRAREISAALKSVGIWRGLVKNVHRSGEHFWCEASVTRFEDPQHGSVWITIQRDASRRIAEERRRDDDAALFRALFEESLTPKLVVTESLIISEVNDAFCTLLGANLRDLVGSPVMEMTDIADTALTGELIVAAFAAGRPVLATRLQLTRAGGEVIDVDTRVQALTGEAVGQRLALVTVTPCDRERTFRRRSRETRAGARRSVSG